MKLLWPKSFPSVVGGLDLNLPALIEASAGTGKTFAIEHLILRMCREKNWKPEEILVLSFTEKTTGELRDRIRGCFRRESGIKSCFKKENGEPFWTKEEQDHFSETCLLCDEASIHTLHGFCHSALRAHAIENRSLFSSELANDGNLLNIALDGLLRGPWARDEERLRRFRDGLNIDPDGKWRKSLIKIALAFQPERGDKFEPRPDPEDLSKSESDLNVSVKNLEITVSEVEKSNFPMNAHRQSFGSSKTGENNLRKDPFIRVFNALEEAFSLSFEDKVNLLSHFFMEKFDGRNKAVKDGFAACLSKKAASEEKWQCFAEACKNLREKALQLEEDKERQRLGIMAEAASELREQLAWEKRRCGVLSYDDMVSRLVLAMRNNPDLAEKLGGRYEACIVDEFQDTDPLQWELLKRLCLEGTRRIPLFLVGDPKQAIYSFRGGDLKTYLEARRWMRDKSRDEKAQGFGLWKNHRSDARLIEALNAVFSHPDWFALAEEAPLSGQWHLPEGSGSITFTPAEAAVKGGDPKCP